MSNKKDLEKVDELLAFTQQAKYFFEKIANIIQGQQEQQNNEPYGVPGSSRAVSSRAVSSRGSSQAGSQQEPILISSDEDITIKMEKSDTAVTSGISEKGEESAVTSATNEKEDESAGAVTSATNEKEDVSAVTSATTNEKYRAISDKAKGKAPVQSSSDDSSDSDSSYNSNSSNTPFYLMKSDMPKDLREALRKEVIWKYDALPEGRRIDLGQTFTNQRNRIINDIIPSIMENINNNIFPISNEILYDIIYSLHRHRREEHLKKNRSSSRKKLQEKRKHSNTRRHDVKKIKRGRLIKHLQMVKNSLVKKFKDEDLQLIIDNNAYHSPEESETDCENGRSNILVKDLKWRSDTLRLFLREYIDRLRTEQPNNRKLRERVTGNCFCNNELAAPLLAPHWTHSGYKGKLKIAVTQQLDQRQDQQYDLMKFAESEKSFNDGYDADVGEGEEEMEETVLLTSTDQPSNQSSN
ncbi:uncharacterized protein OCT59_027721 [Rhizophagus irregularis]|uniref:uncharacterized protein n=1 Tax=Rhizophagus irregularis TaxID=588596 RepID=UPI00331B5F70|nr:hypothetical protein OCT59_027721 [Rhizophagus irregularis]